MQDDTVILGDGAYGVVFSKNDNIACKQTPLIELTWVKEVAIAKYLESPYTIKFNLVKHDRGFCFVRKKPKMHNLYIDMKKYRCLSHFKTKTDKNILLILRDISNALNYCEIKKILHRDIKESNILLEIIDGKIQQATLADFGLSFHNILEVDMTTNVVTATHRPPELPEKSVYDSRIDTWGFGLTLAYLVTGEDFHKYTKKDLSELTKLIKNRTEFLALLQKFIKKYTHMDLKHTEFYSTLINKCLKPYSSRPYMSEIFNLVNKYVDENKILLPPIKNNKAKKFRLPTPEEIKTVSVKYFSPRFFKKDVWENMENTVDFINSENLELIYFTRLLLTMEEEKLFLLQDSTEIMFISLYIMVEMIFIDVPMELDDYKKILRRAKIPFSKTKSSQTILKIMKIFDFDIINIISPVSHIFREAELLDKLKS